MLILIWVLLKAGFAILSHRALLWLFLFVLPDTFLFCLTHAAAISMGAASRAPQCHLPTADFMVSARNVSFLKSIWK